MCPQGGQLLDKSGSLASFWGQTSALTRRSFRNMFRDLGYYWLRLIIYIALGVSIGTVFQNVGTSWNSIRVSRVLYLWTPMPTTWFVSIFIATECNHSGKMQDNFSQRGGQSQSHSERTAYFFREFHHNISHLYTAGAMPEVLKIVLWCIDSREPAAWHSWRDSSHSCR